MGARSLVAARGIAGWGAHFALHSLSAATSVRSPAAIRAALATGARRGHAVFETDLRGDVALLFGSEARIVAGARALAMAAVDTNARLAEHSTWLRRRDLSVRAGAQLLER